MKWILITVFFITTQAEATLIQYTFDVAARDPFSAPAPGAKSDMTLLVDSDSLQITSLVYRNNIFDINFHGNSTITSRFWWLNQDGTGYYAISSIIEGALPDDGRVVMYLEASMPVGANPAHFLHQGTDGQAFSFYTKEGTMTHVGFWSESKKVIVPEPATLSLFALGLAAFGLRRRFR